MDSSANQRNLFVSRRNRMCRSVPVHLHHCSAKRQFRAHVMRSRGIIEFDDVAAFDSVVSQQEILALPVGLRTAHLYQEVAQSLGVETGLEIPPIFRG